MARVDDVAAAILERTQSIDTFKLQKLVYYSQAWHLVWDGEPLFDDEIQAWANGPVCRTLYERHKGQFTIKTWPDGDSSRLSTSETETVEAVVRSYGGLTGRQLSHMTHNEAPWIEARQGLAPGQRGERTITPASMAAFYSAVDADESAIPVGPNAIDLTEVQS